MNHRLNFLKPALKLRYRCAPKWLGLGESCEATLENSFPQRNIERKTTSTIAPDRKSANPHERSSSSLDTISNANLAARHSSTGFMNHRE